MSSDARARINPVLPEYFNAEGRGLYAYLTGSASWFIHTLLGEVLGIRFSFGDLVLEPKLLPDDFSGKKEIRVSLKSQGGMLRFVFVREKGGDEKGPCAVTRVLAGNHSLPGTAGEYRVRQKDLLRAAEEGLEIRIYVR
jgi:cellobiose phosphorylase